MRLMVPVYTIACLSVQSATAFVVAPRTTSLVLNRQPPTASRLYDKKKPLSTSEQERWEEDKRRKERKDDVIIGKTSAIPGEEDFNIDPKKTEEEWMKQASDTEQEVFRLTDLGLSKMKTVGY